MMVIFLVVVLGAAYFLYRLFFYRGAGPILELPGETPAIGSLPKTGAAGQATGTAPVPGQPTAGLTPGSFVPSRVPQSVNTESRTQVLYDKNAKALSLSPTGNGVRSYDPVSGKFYRIGLDGKVIPLSDQAFYNVEEVTWGKRSDKAVLEYPDGSKILYDFTSNKQVTLPKHWEDFDFSPQDDSIAAKSIGNNESNRFLIVSNPDGTEAHPVEELGENQDKVHVSWSPNNQMIAYSFTGEPIGYDRQSIIMLGQHQENYKSLIVEGRGFIPNWAPSGNTIAYSVYSGNNNYNPRLWISGGSAESMNANRRDLDVETWADKCAWQNETTLLCAVPTSLPEGAGLQRALANDIPDEIFKIDLREGQKINLGRPEGSPTIDQLVVSSDGGAIVYTDRNTGKLMKFAL